MSKNSCDINSRICDFIGQFLNNFCNLNTNISTGGT